MNFYLLVFFASYFLAFDSFGQATLSDSVKTNLNISDDIIKKLDSKDIVELVKFKEKLLHDKEMATKFAVDPSKFMGKFIPIMPIIGFTFILLVLTIPFYFNFKKSKGRQLIINNLIEKGQEIPLELLVPAKRNVRSDFHKGIILITFGLSVCMVLFLLKTGNNFWTFGLIPLFIGIGYLITSKFDNTSKDKSEIS
jgi:hypothetical protein